MIERGDTKIMAIDSTKFEKSAFAKSDGYRRYRYDHHRQKKTKDSIESL